MSLRNELTKANRIVIKLGTRILTYPSGKLNLNYIEKLVRAIADLKNQGKEIILVSSGAQGAGMGKLGLNKKPVLIQEKQAVAAVGQGLLIQFYEKLFAEYGHTVAQVLLTREDLKDKKRYLNAKNALSTLLKFGVIPIVNENDTVSIEEIEFGDNDTLSALVSSITEADLLIILSDIDGVYTANPKINPEAKKLRIIDEITPEIKRIAEGTAEKLATGGMKTKIQAAEIATDSGISTVIAYGREDHVLHKILAGEDTGTLILGKHLALPVRKRWLAYGPVSQGAIVVDTGAKNAVLSSGKSLLPTGVLDVIGIFYKGEMVKILDKEHKFLAKGLTNFSSEELEKIKGLHTSELKQFLKENIHSEVIHRDKLVICNSYEEEC